LQQFAARGQGNCESFVPQYRNSVDQLLRPQRHHGPDVLTPAAPPHK
jgi:hypothetical protein